MAFKDVVDRLSRKVIPQGRPNGTLRVLRLAFIDRDFGAHLSDSPVPTRRLRSWPAQVIPRTADNAVWVAV